MKNDVINIFEEAMNDWPHSTTSISDFIDQVELFINKKATKTTIENRLRNIDLKRHAWESESLTILLNLYESFNEGDSLYQIYTSIN